MDVGYFSIHHMLLIFKEQKTKELSIKNQNFSIKDFFSKCDQIHSFLWIWSHLLKKSLMENFIFCTVIVVRNSLSM